MKKEYDRYVFTNNSKYVMFHYIGSYAASIPKNTQVGMYDSFNRLEAALDKQHRRKGQKKKSEVNWVARDSLYSVTLKSIILTRPKQLAAAYIGDIKENSSSASQFIPVYGSGKGFQTSVGILNEISKWQNVLFSVLAFILTSIIFIVTLVRLFRRRLTLDIYAGLLIAVQVVVFISLGGLSFWQGDRFSIVFYPLILVMFAFILRLFQRQGPTGYPTNKIPVNQP